MKTTAKLRQLLRQPGIIVAPGAYDCLTARLIECEGFPAVYMTGAGTAVTRVGTADLGFATLSEMVSNAAAIAATVSIPLIADADTGYGGSLNVYRSGLPQALRPSGWQASGAMRGDGHQAPRGRGSPD